MIIEIHDRRGNLITEVEIFDDVFRRLELQAADKGISVEEHILTLLRNEFKKMSEELDNGQDEA